MAERFDQLDKIEGTVKWFDPRKGYGFVVGPDGQDVFVHFSCIEGDGFKVLKDGTTVEYDARFEGTRWKATRVKRLDDAEIVVPPRRGYSRSPRR